MNFPSLDQLKAEIEQFHCEQIANNHFYLQELVEGAKFYGTGDEGVELFQATCSLAYQQYGMGETWLAVLLVKDALEQAEASREWCEENDWDMSDYENGHWGYNG